MLFKDSDIPEKYIIRMMLSKKGLSKLTGDRTYVHKRIMVDRYLIRQKDAMFENLSYALFIERHQLQVKSSENDSKTVELVDAIFEANHRTVNSYMYLLILPLGKRLHYCKVELVLRYHVPNKFKDLEGCAHYLIFIFYQFRDGCELKVEQTPLQTSKLSKPGVSVIINKSKCLVEPYSD